ncbi:MAG: hydantoinase/oxoprolinase [Candidatus Eremiobacteraeota bacterium]|nr:hydantoinase/oxoprolinase [Candidatus Eremiobacteraeota bacterium]
MTERTTRVGIDVGGTFTDVVAVDAQTRKLVARIKVPTTHGAAEGVAAGIVTGIERLLADATVDAASIAFIAHSTTQATNALLEGDLARVGVIGLLDGVGWLSKRQMRFGAVRLAGGSLFAPAFAFAPAGDESAVRARIDGLIACGAEAIAASESFGVDRPAPESFAVAYAQSRGIEATSGHDVSSAYGLRARTRTAALNAAILPAMVRTARMTASAVSGARIPAPLMVMRSDGGVMGVNEIERRPILTLLSGPAAGVAGALFYERLSDGIFIEVGGTSSDCSAIRAGRPQMQAACVGGHRTMLRTLDVRTLGIGGGSMLRLDRNGISDVGPRSAHIAGCAYASFVAPASIAGSRLERIAPTPRDQPEYAALIAPDGRRIALTATCAANFLGTVPADAFAHGNAESAQAGFELLARELGTDASSLARTALTLSAAKLRAAVEQLITDYELDPSMVTLVGGGGGAGALVPFTAGVMGLSHRIARDAEVIAPIGVALALVRDSVERTIVAPAPHEIARIRREAGDRVIAAGAAADRVEIEVEIDAQRNKVRATASGATALVESWAPRRCGEEERCAAAAESLRTDSHQLEATELTPRLWAYQRRTTMTAALRHRRERRDVRVVDDRGVVRLALRDPVVTVTTVERLGARVRDAIESGTQFGDVGRALPALYLLRANRIATYEGLASAEQGAALAQEETQGCASDEPVALLVVPRQA